MDKDLIPTFLNQTVTCKACKGTGKIGDDKCQDCQGNGIVIDSFVPDLIAKETGVQRRIAAQISEKIIHHFEAKLRDSYERGLRDAKKNADEKDA
jgi:RecJ-like exonuclease